VLNRPYLRFFATFCDAFTDIGKPAAKRLEGIRHLSGAKE
jgi:hypothetical protein